MDLSKRRTLALLGSAVAVLIVLTALAAASQKPQKIVITDFDLLSNTDPPSLGCFPHDQAFPASLSVVPGTVVKEELHLTDATTNMRCTYTALNVTTSGFELLSFFPPLPWTFDRVSNLNVSLTIQTPGQVPSGQIYDSIVHMVLEGNATLLTS